MERNNRKQNILIFLGLFVLIGFVGGFAYTFFNYTRTGSSNTIQVGRIAFVTRQTRTINLTNVFPIDSDDVSTDTNNVGTVEIEIEGDTDYNQGVEYLVSSTNSNIYTSTGKLIPISLDVTITNLGTSSNNYFIAREDKNTTIYKQLVGDTLVGDQMLLVGYIKPNTTTGTKEGVNGKITIKAYFDKDKIGVSDTYDGTESDNMGTTNDWANGRTILTTTEWNNLSSTGISFQVKVEANEGIWVKGSLEEIMKVQNLNTATNQPIMDNVNSINVTASTGINFGATSRSNNGEGVYMRAGTENDDYPILYYRGAVVNNNVIFNNICWKAVRTTDTGGVKLIYSGVAGNVYGNATLSENHYTVVTNTDGTNMNVWTFDSTDNSWNASYTTGNLELSFKVPSGDGYVFEMTGQNGASGSGSYTIFKGTTGVNGGGGGGGAEFSLNHTYGTLTADDVVKFTFSGGGFTTPSTFKIKMIGPVGDLITANVCNNTGANMQISLNGTNTFTFSGTNLYTSPAYNGYMWGTVYPYSASGWTSGAYFGSGFTWDGTNYKLVDATVTTPDATHHYSCNSTNAEATCTDLRYVYYKIRDRDTKYYITLTGGDGIEEAIEKMQTNTTNSYAKDIIDTWYANNMTGVTNKLEDTIWCNDRSMGNGNNNGWIANGGDLTTYLYYGAYQRSNHASNTSTVKNQPSLACANKNDAFTVTNGAGNQKLQYPVAMLTEDEIVLAGGLAGSPSTFYLKNESSYNYWSLSPYYFDERSASEFYMVSNSIAVQDVNATVVGLRPAISLKPGMPIISGNGTVMSPYVIE